MKLVTTFFCVLAIFSIITCVAIGDVQWRLTANKNDMIVGGDYWLNLQIKHDEVDISLWAPSKSLVEGGVGILRTLASATVDIEYTDALIHLKRSKRAEFQENLNNMYSYTSQVTQSDDPLLYQVTITQGIFGVSGDDEEGEPPGFTVTNEWTTVVILKWQIAEAEKTYIGIKDDSLGTGFFKYYNAWSAGKRDGEIESQEVSAEDLGDQSLPVTFSSITATTEDEQVSLKWTTETEVNNLGFFVYRGESEDGPFVKLNDVVIEGAMNSGSAHDYEYIDIDVEGERHYYYYIENIDISGKRGRSKIVEVLVEPKVLPEKFAVFQNYPNPFNPETWIPYQLANSAEVVIHIYNISGQLVKTLYLGEKIADFYISKKKAAYWDGRNNIGEKVSSGLYFYNLQADDYSITKRMVILK